ncbi:unnamed protein product [Heterosigma akashiwo]
MMVIYTPALITSMTMLALGVNGLEHAGPLSIPSPSLAAAFCVIHFAKRCLEVMFLHVYSGRTDRGTPTQIGVLYALYAMCIAYSAGRDGHDYDFTTNKNMIAAGTLLFTTGIVGNFYHHYLLARLRAVPSTDSKKKYVAPRGGLFCYVAAPHYLFELVGWLGIAIAAHHLNVYLLFAVMLSYLSGRSVAQNDFNRRKFEEEWPAQRKNLIPFVF